MTFNITFSIVSIFAPNKRFTTRFDVKFGNVDCNLETTKTYVHKSVDHSGINFLFKLDGLHWHRTNDCKIFLPVNQVMELKRQKPFKNTKSCNILTT